MAEKYDIEKYNRRLEKFFDDDEDRYYHTQGVRYTAVALAMAHGEDYQKAELAGLLHDSAKNIPDPKKIKLCEKNDTVKAVLCGHVHGYHATELVPGKPQIIGSQGMAGAVHLFTVAGE